MQEPWSASHPSTSADPSEVQLQKVPQNVSGTEPGEVALNSSNAVDEGERMTRCDSTTMLIKAVPGVAPTTNVARLVVLQGDTLGRSVAVGEQAVILGRSAACDFRIEHASVSRQHCKIWREADRYYLADLGSTNMTRCNDHAIEHILLQDQDRITIGEVELKFLGPNNQEANYHQAQFEMAHIDHLTQLPNRKLFREALDQAIFRCGSGTSAGQMTDPLVLAFIDLDHFKLVNDRAGHLAGDEVLKLVAEVLRDSLRDRFIGGRLGGEEFVVLMANTRLLDAARYAEQLRHDLEQQRHGLPEGVSKVTASMGLAQWDPKVMSCSADLMRAADMQLLKAKSNGRNCVMYSIFTP